MIKVVTAGEMREIDRFTIEDIGVPGVVLMENAGLAAFRIILHELEGIQDPLVYVFCGKGNNGGDGFVVARHLWNEGVYVRVFCTVDEHEIEDDARINYNILQNMHVPIEFVTDVSILDSVDDEPDMVVDALLGTGLRSAPSGTVKSVIDFINSSYESKVVSIDVPSGLNASSPKVDGVAVRADITVTMALPKRCHTLYPAKNFVGELFIADIGTPPSVLNDDDVLVDMLEQDDIVLPFRYPDAHKYECGKVGVLAGSKGFSGAATLTAEAAQRMGAGLTILAVPESINPVVEQKLTEVITRPLPETKDQTVGKTSMKRIEDLLEWCDVLAIGPGLGRSKAVEEVVVEILTNFDKPIVIDADALLALANNPHLLKSDKAPNWILTPHMGEFLRFFPDETAMSLGHQRIEKAQEFASEYGLTLMLKGAPALVAMPDKRIYLNPTGNPGLASGGTGDVLTGLTAGLLAQRFRPDEAAYTANFVHGYVADYVVNRTTQYSLMASDLTAYLGEALNEMLKPANGG